MRFSLALGLAALCACRAGAAELPSRGAKGKPPEAKARTCEIGGQQGFVTPGGGCLRVGGYVSVGATGGNAKH